MRRTSLLSRLLVFLGKISIHDPQTPGQVECLQTALQSQEPPDLEIFDDLKTLDVGDYKTLYDALRSRISGGEINDKTYFMERLIQLISKLPVNSVFQTDLTNILITDLWTTLPHPPLTFLGDNYQYRQPDGSYNNIINPQLGAAHTPYARSVPPKTLYDRALPEAGLVFDTLFSRKEFHPHPNKISSALFYHATIIIHDLFQTSHTDYSISDTSSYLDLSPLYGDDEKDQKQVRLFRDGKLKPDCFSEQRLLLFPPGVGCLLIMYNRFHNFVVEQLAMANEDGKFANPSPDLLPASAELAWAKYDEDLFQTGRLITCGLYVNITLIDYVRTILNLNRSDSVWNIDPRQGASNRVAVTAKDLQMQGMGNQVSAEFNLAYRWHSALSQKDEQWTEDLQRSMFGKDPADITMSELLQGLKTWEQALPADPLQRPFGNITRKADGSIKDAELLKIWTEAVEDPAGAFGARNVPLALRSIEILGMQQARKWNVATLNEFRAFFGLRPHKTFEDINPDPEVAASFRALYSSPDHVEMYPGMVAEDAKASMIPGSGIALPFTISRAILSDAVALVRGDRFYTTDYSPRALTNWGYRYAAYDVNVEQGCSMSKLVLCAFNGGTRANCGASAVQDPESNGWKFGIHQDSIYAHQPFTTPGENRIIMENLGREGTYDWERPI
ncbi:hypothetical protein MMC25_008200 [Agyrium rufum]|nr:hypothetical protein [Agyrium rufum]